MEVNKTDGDKVEIEDQKEDADYDDEEDDNDDDDDDDEEEEDDDGDEDDDEEDDGEDDNDGDEGDKENKRKFFLQDLKLFDCSNCHKRLFNPVYMCENEHIACHSCCSSSSSKCKSCAPSASFKRCQILEKIIQSLGGSCKYLKYGCSQTANPVKDCHEVCCKFVPCSCPIEGCNYYGPLMQLSMHLSGQHRDSITCFRYNKLYSITLRYDERFCVLQEMSDGDIFLVDNVEHDIGNMVSVSRIGPYTFISPFSIELKIEAVKWVHWDQLSLRLSCKIESIRSRVGYQPSTRDFLLVPSGYFEGGEEFELLFCISRADV